MALPNKVLPGFSASMYFQYNQVTGSGTVAASVITLPSTFTDGTTASAVTNFYTGAIFIAGTSYPIVSYNGGTRALTVTGTPPAGTQSFVLYTSAGGTPTALTAAQMGTLAQVQAITFATNLLNIQTIPAFGQDDASVSFPVAGARQSDKMPTQAAGTSMTITATWNPSDAGLLQMRADAYSGTIDRTYVIAATEGSNTVYYSFTGRASNFQIDSQPGAEAKAMFTIHPRAGLYNWVNN